MSPDKKRLVTGSRLCQPTVWDAETGLPQLLIDAQLGRGDTHCELVTFVGNDLIAVAARPGEFVDLHNARTGKRVSSLKAGPNIEKLVGSPDGTRLVVVDQSVRLFDVPNLRQIAELHPNKFYASFLPAAPQFSADSKRLLTIRPDRTVQVWNAVDGSPVQHPPLPEVVEAKNAVLSTDGTMVAMEVYNVQRQNGRITGWSGGRLRTIDLQTGQDLPAPAPPLEYSGAWMSLRSDTGVLTAVVDERISRWNVKTGKQISSVRFQYNRGGLVFSADGTRAFSATGVPMVVDMERDAQIHEMPDWQAPMMAVACSPDGRHILTGSSAALVRWDLATGKFLFRRRTASASIFDLAAITYSDDGKSVFGCGAVQSALLGSDWLDGTRAFPPNWRTGGMSISADFKVSVRRADQQTFNVFRMEDLKELSTIQVDPTIPPVAMISPDGKVVAVTGRGTALFDASTGQKIRQLPPLPGSGISWAPDGTAIASAGVDAAGCVDLSTGEILWKQVDEPTGYWPKTFYSPGGLFLCSLNTSGFRLRDARTGQVLASRGSQNEPMLAGCFSADGRRLITTSYDCTALVWDVPTLILEGDKQMPATAAQAWEQLSSIDLQTATIAQATLVGLLAEEFERMVDRSIDQMPAEQDWAALVKLLSDPDPAVRERAHRELERGGIAAAAAVSLALRDPPPGEAGERLRSIARLNQISREASKVQPGDRAAEATTAPGAGQFRAEQRRVRRIVQALEWLGGARDGQLLERMSAHGVTPARPAAARIKLRLESQADSK